MSTKPPAHPYRLYPAYCFRASPTFDAWVKITAADVQLLRAEPEFSGQHIYFFLNHPIRYVRLVGVVVAIDDINLKYTVLTIDDGSGATIELKIVRIPVAEKTPVDTSSNTTISNVNILSRLGLFEVVVDDRLVDIGTVIKVKGTIAEFRGVKQLDLKRVWIVTTTDEEAQAWAETAAFKQNVLSKRWRLTSAEHKQITDKIKADKRRSKEYERHQKEYEAKKEEHKRARELHLKQKDAKWEMRRRKEEIMMNAGALL